MMVYIIYWTNQHLFAHLQKWPINDARLRFTFNSLSNRLDSLHTESTYHGPTIST